MGKNVHNAKNFKQLSRHMTQQGFGPFRQRFAQVPKDVKTILRAGNVSTPQGEKKEAAHETTAN